MKSRYLIIPLAAILLAACSTPYQSETPFNFVVGGYSSKPAADGLLKVSFSSSRSTTMQRTKELTLLRIAEIGKQRNKAYFSMYQTITDEAMGRKTNEPTIDLSNFRSIGYAYVRYKNVASSGDLSVNDVYQRYKKRKH